MMVDSQILEGGCVIEGPDTMIEERVKLLAGCKISAGVTIGKASSIGRNEHVTASVPPGTVIGDVEESWLNAAGTRMGLW